MVPTGVVIAGAGGHGSEVRQYLEDLKTLGEPVEYLGSLDDTLPAGPHPFRRLYVLGSIDVRQDRAQAIITAVGDNAGRRRVVERLQALYGGSCPFWTLVHPAAYAGKQVEIGAGTCVAPGAVLTERVRIGRHCIVNVKASVSHDCEIGDFVSLNPGATVCGSVRIGDGACIGAGATVIEGLRIGAGAMIGAGAVVIGDIPEGVTAAGVPARVLRTNVNLRV